MIFHDNVWACVEAREDMDGDKGLWYSPDRREDLRISLSASEARVLARKLNKFANFIDPPKRKRRR